MRKLILSFILIVCCMAAGRAQDTHFSQYNTTPLSINPAMTGVYDGLFRFSNNYRSQWSSLGKGYNTIYSSIDFPMGKVKNKEHYFGGGVMVNTDKAGENAFYTTQVELSLAFTAALNDYGTHFFSVGLQGGLVQRGMDLTKTTWDSQWNGNNYDPTLLSGENIQLDQFAFPDFNAGFMWYCLPDEYNNYYAGLAFAHFNMPNTTFYVEEVDEMPIRYTFHGGADLAVDRNENGTWVSPKILYMRQGGQNEFTLGGYVKNRLIIKSKYTNYRKEVLLSWGACYRWSDAIVASARMDYGRFGFGISYDINVSSLSTHAGSANSFEFSLSYITPIKRGQADASTSRMPRFF